MEPEDYDHEPNPNEAAIDRAQDELDRGADWLEADFDE